MCVSHTYLLWRANFSEPPPPLLHNSQSLGMKRKFFPLFPYTFIVRKNAFRTVYGIFQFLGMKICFPLPFFCCIAKKGICFWCIFCFLKGPKTRLRKNLVLLQFKKTQKWLFKYHFYISGFSY